MPWTIYCHTHIESGRKYVGLTSQTILQRWNQHVSKAYDSKGGRWHFPNAIRKYGKDAFSHEILEVCDSLESANLAEEKWIEFHKTRDLQFGFNLMKGGNHIPHPKKNPWDRPEYRVKSLMAAKARWNDPAIRARCVARYDDPEYRAKMALAQKAVWNDPEYRFKRSALWADPEFRARASVASKKLHARPEVKEKLSRAKLGRRHSPEMIEKFRASNRSGEPEIREKIRNAISGRKHKPESIIKMSVFHTARGQVLASRTHITCKVHGLISVNDCYRPLQASGRPSFRCKLCQIEYYRVRRKCPTEASSVSSLA